jgi:ubiquinone/menaquinone biosynthesis C-methylase UbiE
MGKSSNYLQEIYNYITPNSIVLDIGTGNGKVPIYLLSDRCKEVYGIDYSKELIRVAKENLSKENKKNVHFILADARKLPFPSDCFDLAIARLAPPDPKETYRVLKPNCLLIYLSRGERDKQNIHKVFGRQPYNKTKGKKIKAFEKVGFRLTKMEEYNVTEFIPSKEDFIYLLENSPILGDFDIKKDRNKLKEFERRYKMPEGFKTNSHKYLFVFQKPGSNGEKTNLEKYSIWEQSEKDKLQACKLKKKGETCAGCGF